MYKFWKLYIALFSLPLCLVQSAHVISSQSNKAGKICVIPHGSFGTSNQSLITENQNILYFISLIPCMKQHQNSEIFGNLFLWVFGTWFYELVYLASNFSSYLLKITTWILRGCQRITSRGRILLFSHLSRHV